MTKEKRLTAIIDLDAAAFNIEQIQKKTKRRLIGIVKADSYGHGALEYAKLLQEKGVDFFAVGPIEEAWQLRRAGFEEPILPLGYVPPSQISRAIAEGIRITVFSYETAALASEEAGKLGKTAYLHMKLDTGMGRLGFLPEEAVRNIVAIAGLPHVEIEGLFTHFSTADMEDKAFTALQVASFASVCGALKEQGIHIPMTHCANSAGVMDFPEFPYTAVRPGIILYGLYPSSQVHTQNLNLRPVMSLVSCVSMLKTVPKDTPIGYGRTYYTGKEARIATIPAGYADGYARAMQHGGRVLICGKAAPVVGRVCMDQFMVDVTEIPEVQLGDEVVLMGRQGNLEITADEIAAICGTISYEITCRVSKRVPREYYRNGKLVKTVSYV